MKFFLMAIVNALSLQVENIDSYQLNASFITRVSVSMIEHHEEKIIKASPVMQIRSTNTKPFRLWLEGVGNLGTGEYLVFYNLCGDIGYPTMNLHSVIPIVNGKVSFDTKNKGWITIAPSKIRK